MEKELEKAHQDYEKRKHEIITKLICLKDGKIDSRTRRTWLSQAINFINEREV
jgi:hypothetical protein